MHMFHLAHQLQSLPVDASRRVSVSEVTTSLETAVLNDDKKQPSKLECICMCLCIYYYCTLSS